MYSVSPSRAPVSSYVNMCVCAPRCVCVCCVYVRLTSAFPMPVHAVQVIFIIDDFERFAKQRGKQTLLYNLLDELQHSNVQVGGASGQ